MRKYTAVKNLVFSVDLAVIDIYFAVSLFNWWIRTSDFFPNKYLKSKKNDRHYISCLPFWKSSFCQMINFFALQIQEFKLNFKNRVLKTKKPFLFLHYGIVWLLYLFQNHFAKLIWCHKPPNSFVFSFLSSQ